MKQLNEENFCFAVRKEDTALKADLDKVIGEMKSDGSLYKIIKEYIADVDTPEGVELSMPYFNDNIEHLKLKK